MKLGKTAGTLGAALLVLVLFFGCGQRIGEKEYNKALRAIHDNNLVEARLHLENAIKRINGDLKSIANHKLGIVCWKLQDTPAAIEAFNAARNLTEVITESNLNLAAAYFQSEDYMQTELELRQILNENPSYTAANILSGLIEIENNNWEKAAERINATLRGKANTPASENILAISEELYKNRNSDAALQRLLELHTRNPNYAAAIFNIAAIYDHWKAESDKALKWYNDYLAMAPEQSAQRQDAIRAIQRLDPKANQEQLTKTDTALAGRYIDEGYRLYTSQNYTAALSAYQKAAEADPTNMDAYYSIGVSYYALQNYKQAQSAFRQALRIDPNAQKSRYMLAASYHGNRNFAEAEQEINELLSMNPNHQDALALQKIIQKALRQK